MKVIQVLIFESAAICWIVLQVHFYTSSDSVELLQSLQGPKLTSNMNGVNTSPSGAQAEQRRNPQHFV